MISHETEPLSCPILWNIGTGYFTLLAIFAQSAWCTHTCASIICGKITVLCKVTALFSRHLIPPHNSALSTNTKPYIQFKFCCKLQWCMRHTFCIKIAKSDETPVHKYLPKLMCRTKHVKCGDFSL